MKRANIFWNISLALSFTGMILGDPIAYGAPFYASSPPVDSKTNPDLVHLAQQIIVKVRTPQKISTGTILAKRDNTYLVITYRHEGQSEQNIQLQTHDGQNHSAKVIRNSFQSQNDMILLEFVSSQSYPVPQIATFTPRRSMLLFIAGYRAGNDPFQTQNHQLEAVASNVDSAGEQLTYFDSLPPGIEGAPVFERNSYELIGIHGRLGQSDLSKDSNSLSTNVGTPIQSILTQIQPTLLSAYQLPFPAGELTQSPEATGWIADVADKAKQLTVQIVSNSGEKGSGVMIAKQDNRYTVLTANHVVCQAPHSAVPCPARTYQVVAPDGNQIIVDPDTIQRQVGVDLAILEFESAGNYEIATLGTYAPKQEDEVFVAGFSQQRGWQLNPGYVFERNQGTLEVSFYRLGETGQSLSQTQVSFSDGYELVYTSLTERGMSGGPVMDRQGNVIGLHGLAEGESLSSQEQVQLGYSLGIPSSTIVSALKPFQINLTTMGQRLSTELTPQDRQIFEDAILKVKIPTGNASAKVWIERGNQLWRLRRYAEAIVAFDRAIALKSEGEYLAWLGKALAQEKIDLAESLPALQNAIQAKADYAPAYLQLSVTYRKLKRFEDALVAINQAITLQPDDAQLLNQKSVILTDLKQYSEALAVNDQAIVLAPRAAFYFNRGTIHKALQRNEDAIASYTKAIALDAQYAASYHNRGLVYADLKQYEASINDYTIVIQQNPELAIAYSNRGNALMELKRYDDALVDFNQAVTLDSKKPIFYHNRGYLYASLNRYDDALADYNKAINLDPTLADTYTNRGIVYKMLGRIEAAVADYNQAIQLNPNLAFAYSNRGLISADLTQYQAAMADYNQAIALDPHYTIAYNNRGIVHQKLQQHDQAIADYTKALTLDPKFAGAYNNLATVYFDLGRVDEALTNFNQAIAFDSEYAIAYFNRGILYKRQGQVDTALADFNQAIALDPSNPGYFNNRGVIYKDSKRYEKAIADFTQTIALAPNISIPYFNRGSIYDDLQRYEEAIADFNQALKLNPTDALSYNNRGIVYKKLKRYDEAIADYTQAIKINPEYADAYYNRALSYGSQEKIVQAKQDLKTAADLFLVQLQMDKYLVVIDFLNSLE
jgi:tetratricopeptide (TPR) repeat protein